MPSQRKALVRIPEAARPRGGITLLEVLVACGILVVGLTSLASILPAAGFRLSQAMLEDRAGTLAENAYAEAITRGLASHSLLASGTQACVFGRVLENLVPDPPTKPGKGRKNVRTVSIDGRLTATGTTQPTLYQRIDDSVGFLLTDELIFQATGVTETPLNVFVNSGTNGPRESKEGVCWGAMLSPVAGTNDAILSIAIFRKEGDYTQSPIALKNIGTPLFAVEDDESRLRFLKGCSYVLVLHPDLPPTWAQVASSWTNRIVLDIAPETVDTRNLSVIGFENLVRVDQYRVTLE